jgi:VWFA-related protein
MQRKAGLRFLAALIGLTAGLTAQKTQANDSGDPIIRSGVREVLLDVIVRRKDMTLDKKLKAADFTITEDGVPQPMKSFRFVGGREARITAPPVTQGPKPAAETAGKTNTLREPNFVSIVFGQMGPDSRRNALAAANSFLDLEFRNNTYAAIFSLNVRLNVLRGFSNDRTVLQKAVTRAVNGTSMELAHATADVLNQTTYTIAGGRGGVSLSANNDLTRSADLATSGAAGAPLSEAQQAVAQIAGAQRNMVTEIEGTREMTALLRLVEYESKIPGRKTVLYLSEGLSKPPGFQEMLRKVVGAANRGNISFYCFDIRGLTAGTSNGTTAGLTASAAAVSQTQSSVPSSPSAARQQMEQDDLVLDALASHVQLNMADLAEGTGGFAVFGTNEFRKNMVRVMEDVQTHYEISYVPTSTLYDGHFRQVKVTLRDPRLTVQSREGYFAVPEMNGIAVAPYEIDGLNALQKATRRDFGFSAAALRFKPMPGGFRYEMGFELETANLTTKVDKATHKARLHATFLALIKDPAGQIVAKVSQEIDRELPEDKIDQFRRGRVIFTSPFEAPSGRYTIDAVVTDPEGNRIATKRISLLVPRPGEPAVSSVAIVHQLDPLEGPRDPGNPLEFPGGRILPSISQTGSGNTPTAVFFVVYPAPGDEKPKVTLEFSKDGETVARTSPEVGIPDEVNALPLIGGAQLPVGNYVVRVTVVQAGRKSEESTAVRVGQ